MKIIAFEGKDKLGKTTQAKLIAEKLGWTYIKFPNEELYSGKIIRSILNEEMPFGAASFQALQILNRLETFERLNPNGYYIFDRYTLSGIVYGLADGLPEEWIREVCGLLPAPDFTLVFMGDPFGDDSDIYGKKQEKIAQLYQDEVTVYRYPTLCVDGKSIEEVTSEILARLPEGLL